jgi:hypothetical protein
MPPNIRIARFVAGQLRSGTKPVSPDQGCFRL